MAKAIVPMGSYTAQANGAMTDSTLFKWDATEGYVVHSGAGEKPQGVILNDLADGAHLGRDAEWFFHSGIVSAVVAGNVTCGNEVASDANGGIVNYTTGIAFGRAMSTATTGETATIFVY